MKLDDALRGVARLGLDTAPVIYFTEAAPQYQSLVASIFNRLGSGFRAVTSVITLGGVLVHPLAQGNVRLQGAYETFLLRTTGLETRPISWNTAYHAADLRARYRVQLTDALQIATALEAGCQAFLTNDVRLKRVTELRVLVLNELEL